MPKKLQQIRKDGTAEAVFDTLGALVTDAKMAADGTAAAKEPEIKLEFEMHHRNHQNPPREWLKRGLVMPDIVEESSRTPQSYQQGAPSPFCFTHGSTLKPRCVAQSLWRISADTNSNSPASLAEARCNASFVRTNNGGA